MYFRGAITFLLVATVNMAEKLPRADTPSLVEELENLGNTVYSAIKYANPKQYIGELARISESLIDKIMFFAIISGEMTSIVYGNTDLDSLKLEVMKNQAMITSKLNSVLSKFDGLKNVISGELIQFQFEENIQKLVNVKEMMLAYSQVSNDVNSVQAVKSCKLNRPRDVITFIKSNVIDAEVGSLIISLRENRDFSKLLHYSGVLLGIFSEAVARTEQCFGLEYGSTSSFDVVRIQQTFMSEKGTFKQYLSLMEQMLKKEVTLFEQNLINWVEEDLRNMMQAHPDLDHKSFSEKVVQLLDKKYPIKKWVVISIEASLSHESDYKMHVSRKGIVIRNENGRSVALFPSNTKRQVSRLDHIWRNLGFGIHRRNPQHRILGVKTPCKDLFHIVHDIDLGFDIVCVDKEKKFAMSHSSEADITQFTVSYYNGNTDHAEFKLYQGIEQCKRDYSKNNGNRYCKKYNFFVTKCDF